MYGLLDSALMAGSFLHSYTSAAQIMRKHKIDAFFSIACSYIQLRSNAATLFPSRYYMHQARCHQHNGHMSNMPYTCHMLNVNTVGLTPSHKRSLASQSNSAKSKVRGYDSTCISLSRDLWSVWSYTRYMQLCCATVISPVSTGIVKDV